MLQSYSFQTIVSLLLSCVPLMTAFLIIARKMYVRESLASLMVICFLYFVKDAVQALMALSPSLTSLTENIFLLLNFSLILVACKPVIRQPSFHLLVPALILSISAVFVTYMLLTGVHHEQTGIQFTACVLVLAASLFTFLRLIRQQELHIFRVPLFWTAAGFFFYHFQYLLVYVGGRQFFSGEPDFLFYSWLIMLLTKTVTYGFFMTAALCNLQRAVTGESRSYHVHSTA